MIFVVKFAIFSIEIEEEGGFVKVDWVPLSHCPACGSDARKALVFVQKSQLFECRNCQLRYLDPCLSADDMAAAYESSESLIKFHDFHADYYNYGDTERPSVTRKEFLKGLDLVESVLPDRMPRSILDVGYGNGFFLALARRRGWEIRGMDTSQTNCALSRKKFNLQLETGDFIKDIPDGPFFDVVSFWDVLEHFHHPSQLIQKARKTLRPGGVVLAAVPNDRSFLRFLAEWLYAVSFGKIRTGIDRLYLLEHTAYYSIRSFRILFERNGFKLSGYFFGTTDLAKYTMPKFQKTIAGFILAVGVLLRLQNRLIAVFKPDEKDTSSTNLY